VGGILSCLMILAMIPAMFVVMIAMIFALMFATMILTMIVIKTVAMILIRMRFTILTIIAAMTLTTFPDMSALILAVMSPVMSGDMIAVMSPVMSAVMISDMFALIFPVQLIQRLTPISPVLPVEIRFCPWFVSASSWRSWRSWRFNSGIHLRIIAEMFPLWGWSSRFESAGTSDPLPSQGIPFPGLPLLLL
jgi:hypothetical protein